VNLFKGIKICYNLYPIVRSSKADKCGPHEANEKVSFQPARLLQS